jgi:hypothetical protein
MQEVVIEPFVGWIEHKLWSIALKGSYEIDEFNLNIFERRMVVDGLGAYDLGLKEWISYKEMMRIILVMKWAEREG